MSQSGELEVLVEEISDGTIVRPIGEIDLRSASLFQAHIAEVQCRNPARLVIDLTDVPEMDSSTLAVLVEAMRVARRGNGMLVLCGLQERVRSLFEVARLINGVFTIVETSDRAMALPNRRELARFSPRGLNCDLGQLLDISAGGVRLLSKRKLKGTVNLRLWNDETGLVLQAEVLWSRRIRLRQHEVRLQFVNLHTEATKRLADIVAIVCAADL